jgi:hypothetical protein
MQWARTARFLGLCVEIVLVHHDRSIEAYVSLTREPVWDQLPDCAKHARLRERA